MSAGFFALAGTLLGVLGTVLTSWITDRQNERRQWRENLRATCAEYAAEISHLLDLGRALNLDPEDAALRREAISCHSRARGLQERMRLTSRSVPTQEAGRWLLHYAYYQWRCTQGGRGDFVEARRLADEWLVRLLRAAREELGLARWEMYEDPPEGLPPPMAPDAGGIT